MKIGRAICFLRSADARRTLTTVAIAVSSTVIIALGG
jgi:hypothetical protein